MGGLYHGLYDLAEDRLLKPDGEVKVSGLDDAALEAELPAETVEALREEAGLALAAYAEFDLDSFLAGDLTPVFFGSALREYGVPDLLGGLAAFAPPPGPQPARAGPVAPTEPGCSGFIFKVQANMDPNHRDRVAFMRICSGSLKRGMKLTNKRLGKAVTVQNPITFFARDRELAELARPGDIVGIPNHGTLRVGDTLSESGEIAFTGIPNFAPEILRRVRLGDPMKQKHLARALTSLAEEGVTQVFKPMLGSQWVVGVVGPLQLDVLKSRLVAEYGLDADLEPSPYDTARWITASDADIEKFIAANRGQMAEDRDGAPVFLAKSAWELNYVSGKFPNVKFAKTRERGEAQAA
jgi:peptide chain release factor 3